MVASDSKVEITIKDHHNQDVLAPDGSPFNLRNLNLAFGVVIRVKRLLVEDLHAVGRR